MNKTLQQRLIDVRQLLHLVQHLYLFKQQTKLLLKFDVCLLHDRGNNGRAEIDGDSIGFLMAKSLHDPFAWRHVSRPISLTFDAARFA